MADENVILRVELGGDNTPDGSATRPSPEIQPQPFGMPEELGRWLNEWRAATAEHTTQFSDLIELTRKLVEASNEAQKQSRDPVEQARATGKVIGEEVADAVSKVVPPPVPPPAAGTSSQQSAIPQPTVADKLDEVTKELRDRLGNLRERLKGGGDEDLAGPVGEAAGGALSAVGGEAAGGAVGAFGGPVGVAAGVVVGGLVDKALSGIVDKIGDAARGIGDIVREFEALGAEFSGVVAAAQGQADVRMTLAQMSAARANETGLVSLAEARSDFSVAVLEIKAAVVDSLLPVAVPVLQLLSKFIRAFEPVLELMLPALSPLASTLQKINDVIDWVKKRFGIQEEKDAEDDAFRDVIEFLNPKTNERKFGGRVDRRGRR